MSTIYEHPGTLLPRLCNRFGPFANMLDVGGGGGICGLDLWDVPRDQIHVLDAFIPATVPPRFILGDGLEAAEIYGPKSFDLVQACEVIEHLPRDRGEDLLAVLERVARRLVVLTTPRGFTEQDPALSPDEPWANNPFQKHLCGYEPEELEKLGYEVVLNGALDLPREEMLRIEGTQIVAWKVLSG